MSWIRSPRLHEGIGVALFTLLLIAAFRVLTVPTLGAALFLLGLWGAALAIAAIGSRVAWGNMKVSDMRLWSTAVLIGLTAVLATTLDVAAGSLGIEAGDNLGRGIQYGLTFGCAWSIAELVATFFATRHRRPENDAGPPLR